MLHGQLAVGVMVDRRGTDALADHLNRRIAVNVGAAGDEHLARFQARRENRIEQIKRAEQIDLIDFGAVAVRHESDGGQMNDIVGPNGLQNRAQRSGIAQIGLMFAGRPCRLLDQSKNIVASSRQMVREPAAGKAARAGDERAPRRRTHAGFSAGRPRPSDGRVLPRTCSEPSPTGRGPSGDSRKEYRLRKVDNIWD